MQIGFKSNTIKNFTFIVYLILLFIYLYKLRVIINTSIIHNSGITVFLFVVVFLSCIL